MNISLKLFALYAPLCAIFLISGCKKKERLTASTYNFSITPPASSILQTESLTLVAHASSSGGAIESNPTWTVSPDTAGVLNTSVGATVVFQPSALGDAIISATQDGVTATSQIAIITYRPSSNTFDVYNDNGLPIGSDVESDIFTSSAFLSELSTGYTPEGIKYERSSNVTTGAFWGVTLDKSNTGLRKNLSSFSTGSLKFSMRLVNRTLASGGDSIRIDIVDSGGTFSYSLVSGSDGFNRLSTDWQEITLSLSSRFPGVDLAHIKVPFAVVLPTLNSALTFDVDAIRWEK